MFLLFLFGPQLNTERLHQIVPIRLGSGFFVGFVGSVQCSVRQLADQCSDCRWTMNYELLEGDLVDFFRIDHVEDFFGFVGKNFGSVFELVTLVESDELAGFVGDKNRTRFTVE